jgi:hypothetical protein
MAQQLSNETRELLERAQRAIDDAIRLRQERHALLDQIRRFHAQGVLELSRARAFTSARGWPSLNL